LIADHPHGRSAAALCGRRRLCEATHRATPTCLSRWAIRWERRL